MSTPTMPAASATSAQSVRASVVLDQGGEAFVYMAARTASAADRFAAPDTSEGPRRRLSAHPLGVLVVAPHHALAHDPRHGALVVRGGQRRERLFEAVELDSGGGS